MQTNLSLARLVAYNFRVMRSWNRPEWIQFLKRRIPILNWLPKYDWRQNFLIDFINGITLAVMYIPQGLAYSLIIGLPPIFGIYTGIVAPLIYAILGTSRHASTGGFAIIALMVGSAIQEATSMANNYSHEITENSLCCNKIIVKPDVGRVIQISSLITFLVGLIQVILGFLHAGLLAVWLSDQLVDGLTCGAAVHILVSQIKYMVGIEHLPNPSSHFGIIKFLFCFIRNIRSIKYNETICSIICCICLLFSKVFIDPILSSWLITKFPMELLLVIFSIIFCYFTANTVSDLKLDMVGHIESGMNVPFFLEFSGANDVLFSSFSIAIVSFVVHIALVKLIAKRLAYKINADQEWMALGIIHIVSSFFGCYAGGSSLSRTITNEKLGTKSQVLCTKIIIVIKASIFLISFLSVVLINMNIGLVVGIVFALLTVVLRSQWAESTCMGRIPGTSDFKGIGHYRAAMEIPGIKVFRFDATLYFANAELFLSRLHRATGLDPVSIASELRETTLQANQLNTTEDATRNEGFVQLTHIIIDCSSFPYIDIMGIEALARAHAEYNAINITVFFACCKVAVRQMFEKTDFYNRVAKKYMFVSISDAVLQAQYEQKYELVDFKRYA
ncbi:unnamed protein product [Dracunculus medinensis]|uniref:STAS domain-containing protein n=1 Tax=Dracunculus medinensis TaxID=318479 RepID=A0A3P7PTT7_DRAME|nr:unnamed protein product [Dracunculus medinensis]